MLARDVMSGEVVTVGSNATLLEALKLLINANVSGLPVLDERDALVGMLSEFDVIRRVVGSDAAGLSRFQSQLDDGGVMGVAYSHTLSEHVQHVMTTPALSAPEHAELEIVAKLMLEHRLKRLPIVTGTTVVGIVSRSDLLKALVSRPDNDRLRVKPSPPPLALVSDDRLRRAVATAVRRAGLAVGGGFDVVARNGIAHLWGQVTDEASHQACRIAVANVPGVTDVFSHMHVVPSRERGFDRRFD